MATTLTHTSTRGAGMTGEEMERVLLQNFRDAHALVKWLRTVPADTL